jgi:hypothetical protein
MKTEICLFDLDYEEMDGNISVILYGRTPGHQRVVVADPAYEPCFYVLPKNLNKAKREIEVILKKRNVKVKRIEDTKKALLGEERKLPHFLLQVKEQPLEFSGFRKDTVGGIPCFVNLLR